MRISVAAIWSTLVLLAVAARVSADNSVASPEQPSAVVDALPAEVDLRAKLTAYGLEPRPQGRRNTCSVFTTAAAMEFALARQAGRGEPLSVEYLNWACNQVINNHKDDRGQFFHHLLKAFDEYGICAESDMPYAGRFDPELAPSDEARQRAKDIHAKALKVHWINPWNRKQGLSDEKFAEIKSVLAAGWPVAAGSDHSRLLVGFKDDAEQPGGGTFYTKDSGSGKFDAVTYEFVKTRVSDAFWVEAPLEAARRDGD